MNAATAGGILGGDVTATVTHKPTPGELVMDSDCTFAVKGGANPDKPTLTIRVHTGKRESVSGEIAAACGVDAVKLIGVGNEAILCQARRQSAFVMQVTGRVRLRVFELLWTIPDSSAGAALAPEARRAVMQNAAEQVAGSLF